MSNKSKGPKRPAGNGGSGAPAGNAIRFGVGIRAGARDTEPLLRLGDPGYVAAQWTDAQLQQLLDLIPEDRRTELEINLDRIADFCRKLVKAAETLEQRDADALKILAREDDVAAREDRLSKSEANLNAQVDGLDARTAAISARELEADAGFSHLRAFVDEEVRQRRSAFEQERADTIAELQAASKSQLAAQERVLDEREVVIEGRETAVAEAETACNARESLLNRQKRRLEQQEEALEAERTEAVLIARQIAQAEVDTERQRRQNAEAMAQRASDECNKAIADLAQFEELRRILGGRKPEVILAENQALRTQCEQLREDLLARPEVVTGDFSSLRKEKEALQVLLNSLQPELERTKIELSKIRVGAIERDGLEKQKIALEKTNQALSAKLNQLGETVDKLSEVGQSKASFPELVSMDRDVQLQRVPRLEEVDDLRKFTQDLQQRIAAAEPDVPLYYDLQDIQLLVAGLATSQLHIFEGISGTGKTSLAKALAKAVGGHCEDIAVQAGWRDKDDLIGHYNPFEKKYAEKPCLKGLYRAQTPRYADTVNVILLDEMNLSHPEQYFSEFLSAIEKNALADRVIELYESELPNPPALLANGRTVRVPENVWFIGTANQDETTKVFAPKTVDRAHIMTLPRHEAEFPLRPLTRRQGVSWKSLKAAFDSARIRRRADVDKMLEELATGPLTKVLAQKFKLSLGNRFDRQARSFLPAFEAAGGSMPDALDHLLASRIFRTGHVTGRYDITRSDLEVVEKGLRETWKGIGGNPKKCLSSIHADLLTKSKS